MFVGIIQPNLEDTSYYINMDKSVQGSGRVALVRNGRIFVLQEVMITDDAEKKKVLKADAQTFALALLLRSVHLSQGLRLWQRVRALLRLPPSSSH